ncbi:DUF7547 family protein [Haloplanus salilacus]|uniref:DUF7547 family protein n=1 Tax=Haloplanus salilacus TaxID=2949994 RepID=UPI0030D0BF22
MPSRDADDELAVLLADLERTLTDLRAAVDEDVRRRRRPPTPGEILRFTEEYTIPTLIALLEATVQSLELLRAVLRLAGPGTTTADRLRERSHEDAPDVVTLRDALGDLREALTRADLPADSAAGSVLSDARALTEEIDDRLADASDRDGRADRREPRNRSAAPDDRSAWERRSARDRSETAGVDIDVREEGDAGGVNVDEELASIKESMGKGERADESERGGETDDEES